MPAGQGHLLFQISGGTGNADMYIRRNSKPTTATWDYRPLQSGNTESISIGNPQAGTWYVMLKGTAAYSGLTLQADYRVSSEAAAMKNNEPVTGNLRRRRRKSGSTRSKCRKGRRPSRSGCPAAPATPICTSNSVRLPKTSSYDYRPYLIGNEEAVEVRSPKAGTWYIMVRGYQAFSGITLVAQYAATATDDATVLKSGLAVTGISGAANSEKFYKIEVPADQAKLEIVLSGGTGDVDLYVRRDVRPTTKEWDYRPYMIGNNEKVTASKPAGGHVVHHAPRPVRLCVRHAESDVFHRG